MPIIDSAALREILTANAGLRDPELVGVVHTEATLRLGRVTVHRDRPLVTHIDTEALDDMSWFRTVPFDLPEHDLAGTACVFHARDHAKDRRLAPEYFVGWVRAGREEELERWRAEMNGQVAELLYERRDKAAEGASNVTGGRAPEDAEVI